MSVISSVNGCNVKIMMILIQLLTNQSQLIIDKTLGLDCNRKFYSTDGSNFSNEKLTSVLSCK